MAARESLDEIKKKLRSAYRRFYLRPQYLARRMKSFAKLPPTIRVDSR